MAKISKTLLAIIDNLKVQILDDVDFTTEPALHVRIVRSPIGSDFVGTHVLEVHRQYVNDLDRKALAVLVTVESSKILLGLYSEIETTYEDGSHAHVVSPEHFKSLMRECWQYSCSLFGRTYMELCIKYIFDYKHLHYSKKVTGASVTRTKATAAHLTMVNNAKDFFLSLVDGGMHIPSDVQDVNNIAVQHAVNKILFNALEQEAK